MKTSRKMKCTIPALAAALALAAVLPVQAHGESESGKAASSVHCQTNENGKTGEAASSVYNLSSGKSSTDKSTSSGHSYTCFGFSGKYTGGWKNNKPNGEGMFYGKDKDGNIISIVGSWSKGAPHGQCQQTVSMDTFVADYTGNFSYGVITGSGEETTVYGKEAAAKGGYNRTVYKGQFANDEKSGEGVQTLYYTEKLSAEIGVDRVVYEGQFADNTWNGAGIKTIYYTSEHTAQHGLKCMAIQAIYSDGAFANGGTTQQAEYYTPEFGRQYGYDCVIYTGQTQNGSMVEPYRYVRYTNGKVYDQGRVKNGKFVSDGEKAVKDYLYDGLREAFEDEDMGDLFDIFGPMLYDRYSE